MNRGTDYIVRILGDAKGLEAARRKVTGQFQRMREDGARTFTSLRQNIFSVRGALFGLAGAFSFSAIAAGARQAASDLQEVRRSADSLGTSVERIQELNFIFQRLRLDTDDVGDALNTLADRGLDAQSGMQSFIDDFRLIGIEVEDLRDKDPAQLFELFVDRIGRMEDPTRRNAAVVRILGDDLGRKLLPFLIKGAEGFEDLRRQAHEAGAVLGEQAIDDATEAAQAFRGLSEVFTATLNRAVAANAGEFRDLANTLNSPATQQGIKTMVSGLSTIAGWLVKITTLAANVGTNLGESIAAAVSGDVTQSIGQIDKQIARIQARLAGSRSSGYYSDFSAAGVTQRRELEAQLAELQRLRQQLIDAEEKARPRGNGGGGSGGLGGGGGGGSAGVADDSAKAIQAIIDRLREQVATTGEAAQATEIYRLEKLGASDATLRLARDLLTQRESQKAAAEAAEAERQAQADAEEALRMRNEAIAELRAENISLIAAMEEEIALQQLGNRERAQAIAVRRLNVEATAEEIAQIRELAGELYDLHERADETAEGMSEYFREAARGIQRSLADFLFDPFEEGLDGLVASFAETIQRMLAEAAAAQLARALFGDGFAAGGDLGGWVGQGLSYLAGGAGTSAGTGHTGGIIGAAGPRKQASPLAWAGAPRMHRGGLLGLAPDEVPFIGLKGERVLSREETRQYERGGTVVVNAPITTPDPQAFRRSSQQVEAAIGAAVSRAVRRNR